MKQAFVTAFVLTYCLFSISINAPAQAALAPTAFGRDNIVVCRVGNGTLTLDAKAQPVFIDEYTPDGVLVATRPLPTVNSGTQFGFTLTGTPTGDPVNECKISMSPDGRSIVLAGYNSSIGTTQANSGTPVVARVDHLGNIDTSTLIPRPQGGFVHSAATIDGTGFWMVGQSGGIAYQLLGGTGSPAVVAAAPVVSRFVQIVNGELVVMSSSTASRLMTVGSGAPIAGPQSVTLFPGFPTSGDLGGFFFADLSTAVTGIDVVYIPEAGNTATSGIRKFSKDINGNWISNGRFPATANVPADQMRNIAGRVDGNGVVTIFAIRSNSTVSQIVKFTDTTGYNTTPNTGGVIIAAAEFNSSRTLFRGVAFAPRSLAPTAASVSISGRVTDGRGRGIKGAAVTVTGIGEPQRALTNAFGYYSIDGLIAGSGYAVSVAAKGYSFIDPVRIVMANDNVSDVDFGGLRSDAATGKY